MISINSIDKKPLKNVIKSLENHLTQYNNNTENDNNPNYIKNLMDKSKKKNLNNFKIKFKELIREKITNNIFILLY